MYINNIRVILRYFVIFAFLCIEFATQQAMKIRNQISVFPIILIANSIEKDERGEVEKTAAKSSAGGGRVSGGVRAVPLSSGSTRQGRPRGEAGRHRRLREGGETPRA